MRRKKLPGRNPICICDHKRSRHWKYEDAKGFGGCKGDKDAYCVCDKFFDKRYCKIDRWDEVLCVFTKLPKHSAKWGYGFDDIKAKVKVSLPTISRRMKLFETLKIVTRHYDFSSIMRDGPTSFRLNFPRYLNLVEEGIIV